MKLTNEEAIALVKVLHPYAAHLSNSAAINITEHDRVVRDLAKRLDEYVTVGLVIAEKEEQSDRYVDPDVADYDDEEEEEEEEEIDDDDDDDDDESEETVDHFVNATVLHDLKPVKTDSGALEFELDEDSRWVNLIVDGMLEHEGVSHVCRHGHELIISGDDFRFDCEIDRFPKGWAEALPLDKLVGVEVDVE